MTPSPTSLTFVIHHAVFRCAPTDTGRYTWATDDGACRAGSVLGTRKYWAACGSVILGREYPTLRRAMRAAVRFEELWGVRRGSPAEALRGPSSSAQGVLFEMELAA